MGNRMTFALCSWAVLLPVMAFAGSPNMLVRDWEHQYRRIAKQIAGGVKGQPDKSAMLDAGALIHAANRACAMRVIWGLSVSSVQRS